MKSLATEFIANRYSGHAPNRRCYAPWRMDMDPPSNVLHAGRFGTSAYRDLLSETDVPDALNAMAHSELSNHSLITGRSDDLRMG